MNHIFSLMSSTIFIYTVSNLALVVHLWFNTDFFAYYVKFIKKIIPKNIYSFLLIDEYFGHDHSKIQFYSYIDFFFFKKHATKNFLLKFILKILSCKICLTVWISVVISILLKNIFMIGISYVILRIVDCILELITIKK